MENAYSAPFLILKLPYVVMKNAMRNWDPIELIKFSLISKRSRNAVKLSTRQNSFELWSCFHWHPQIEVHVDLKNYNLVAPFVNFNLIYIENIDLLRWMRIVFTTNWTDYVSETLNCDVHLFHIDPNHCITRVPFIIDWLNSRQQSIENASFGNRWMNGDNVSPFLEICKVNRSLDLELEQPPETDPIVFNFSMDKLSIRGNLLAISWITIDHILNFDCIHMSFDTLEFSETDMNRFLKAWIEGSNQRMKYFSIFLKHLNHEMLINGIEVEKRDSNVVRIYDRDMYIPVKIEGGTDIRRTSDRILATFKQDDRTEDDPDEKLRFTMVVWEDD